MVNGNGLIKHNYWPYLYLTEPRCIYMLKTECHLDLYMAYIFLNARLLQPSVSMLDQRRILLTGIETAMGCDAGPTINGYWVGRPTLRL